MALITIQEADAALNDVVYPEWDALDDEFKQFHIDSASAYVRVSWDYTSEVDFDWDDDTTWVAGTKDLIAQYADQVAKGNLYATGETEVASTAPIKRKTEKVGSLELTTEYAQYDQQGEDYSLQRLADKWLALGYTRVSGRGSLQRV